MQLQIDENSYYVDENDNDIDDDVDDGINFPPFFFNLLKCCC